MTTSTMGLPLRPRSWQRRPQGQPCPLHLAPLASCSWLCFQGACSNREGFGEHLSPLPPCRPRCLPRHWLINVSKDPWHTRQQPRIKGTYGIHGSYPRMPVVYGVHGFYH